MRAQLFAVMQKELRQAFRDKRMAMVLILAPVVQLTLLGFAVDLDVKDIDTMITDRDRTPRSRELVSGFLADGTFSFQGEAVEPEPSLLSGEAQVVLVLPRGLSSDLAAGRPAQVQVLIDGTDPIVAQTAVNAAGAYFRSRGVELALSQLQQAALAAGGSSPPRAMIEPRPRLYYNPRLKSTVYMVPGVAAVVLLIVTTVVTAMGIARERELGTIEQLLVTPMRPSTLLLGKTIPFALIGLVVAHLVVAVGTNLFSVPIRGSLLALFAGTLLYLMSTLGMGIFISTLARTQQQAILGGFFFLMPAILLSGFMSPIENMPDWIQVITWVNPVRHYVETLRAVLLKGAGLTDVLRPLAWLFGFGTLILTFGSLRFQKRLA